MGRKKASGARPRVVYQELQAGEPTLLVCAFEDDRAFARMKLQGAISFSEFQSRLPSLEKNQPIVFYCDSPDDAAGEGQAVKFLRIGYTNAKVLDGGVAAWKKAGYPILP